MSDTTFNRALWTPPAGPCCVPGCDNDRHVSKGGKRMSRCTKHWQESTAQMRLKARGKPDREDRLCQREGCGQTFVWRSEHPKQETCSKDCYMALRYQRLGTPDRPTQERRNEQARMRHNARQAAHAGMGVEEYDRRRLGACEICGTTEQWPLDWDHCHNSNRFRGFLCRHCNHGLGNFRDSIPALERALDYLRASSVTA